jgi:hypothetical protein
MEKMVYLENEDKLEEEETLVKEEMMGILDYLDHQDYRY